MHKTYFKESKKTVDYSKKCLNLWKKIIKAKARYKCENCGKTKEYHKAILHPHHFFKVSKATSLKYEIENGICLCGPCHYYLHHHSETEINANIISKRGLGWLNVLEWKKNKVCKYDLKMLFEYLKKYFNKYEDIN